MDGARPAGSDRVEVAHAHRLWGRKMGALCTRVCGWFFNNHSQTPFRSYGAGHHGGSRGDDADGSCVGVSIFILLPTWLTPNLESTKAVRAFHAPTSATMVSSTIGSERSLGVVIKKPPTNTRT